MKASLTARNTAVASANKMHDDDVARTYGFRGGLVPGVDVYAYLTRVPAERWGRRWLETGTMSARFHQPVYDGDEVTITADEAAALELRDSAGELSASGAAALPPELADVELVPARPLPAPAERPPAAPEAFRVGEALGSLEFGFHADKAGAYLDDIGEPLAIYRDEGIAHPGWLLRSANDVLAANVRLGPWIHVSSDVTHYGVVHDGTQLSTRARVADVFERKGHKFVALDVVIVDVEGGPVMAVHHTAIYEPRGTALTGSR